MMATKQSTVVSVLRLKLNDVKEKDQSATKKRDVCRNSGKAQREKHDH